MERWSIPFGLLLVFANPCRACILQKEGAEHPWLIRIELFNPHKGTIAHGSLILPNRVLTAASIKLDLMKVINVEEPLKSDALAMTAYNPVLGCNQTRFAEAITFHWKYDNKYKYLHLGEFALLTASENFVTVGGPLLIPKPYRDVAEKVESIIFDLNNGTLEANAISTYMLADKSEGGATIADGKLSFVSWEKCVGFDSFKKIKGDADPAVTNYSFFCSEQIPGKSGAESNTDGFGYDWYQGAPVVIQEQPSSPNMSDGAVFAIGQYLFWTGENGSPFVFAAYTQYLIDFIEDRIPSSSTTINSTEDTATFPTGRQTLPPRSFGSTDERARTVFTIPTGRGNLRCHFPGILVFGLLIFGIPIPFPFPLI